MLSPVSIDSSILECHETIAQSIGTFSPGLTNIISPFCTWSIDISTKLDPLFTFAVFGASHISLAIACDVDHFALASKYFHNDTNIISKLATSK